MSSTLRTPFYGWPRMTVALRRAGFVVNHKRVQRLMQQMGLQALYPKPKTSRPSQGHKLYPYKERIAKGGKPMSSYVLGFQDIDKTKLIVVGGKGANLGELSKIEGIRVPDGFCISTEAFKRIIGETSSINELLDQLSL